MQASRSISSRKLAVLALALALATGSSGCASSGSIQSDPDVPGVPGRVERAEKSPFLAVLLAIFPGIFVHGLGQLYIGKTDRAEDLMAEEGIGICAMGLSAGLNYLAFAENGTADHSHGVEKVYDRIQEVTYWAGGGAAGIFGIAFFFDSWIRDIVESPAAAEAHNRTVRRLYEDTIRTVKPDPAAQFSAGAPSRTAETAKSPAPARQDDGTVPPDPATGVAPAASPGASPQAPGKR